MYICKISIKIFLPSIFCSKSLKSKSDCEWFALVARLKKSGREQITQVTQIKERLWVIRSGHSLQKSDVKWIAHGNSLIWVLWVIPSWFKEIILKNAIWMKKSYFLYVFDHFSLFSPFLCPLAKCSHRSSLFRSFLTLIRVAYQPTLKAGLVGI